MKTIREVWSERILHVPPPSPSPSFSVASPFPSFLRPLLIEPQHQLPPHPPPSPSPQLPPSPSPPPSSTFTSRRRPPPASPPSPSPSPRLPIVSSPSRLQPPRPPTTPSSYPLSPNTIDPPPTTCNRHRLHPVRLHPDCRSVRRDLLEPLQLPTVVRPSLLAWPYHRRSIRVCRHTSFSKTADRHLEPSFLASVKSSGLTKIIGEMGESTHITRVLFCGYYWPASHNYTMEYLQNYPFIQVEVVPLDDVPSVIDKYHLCVVKNRRLDAKTISLAKEMKLIMQYGVGIEGIDIDAATKHGIKVARIPGSVTGNAVSCAEMAIYLMLGLLKKQKEMDIAVKRKDLGEPAGETFLGKTVYIMGFGAIGKELAKRLRSFGVKIIATKRKWMLPYYSSNASGSNEVDDLVDVKGNHEKRYDFASEADIVATCLSMSVDTAGIINEQFLSALKKGSLLVNVARGGLLDYAAVYNSLESGHLGGLGVDVTWTEPFDPDDPILKFQNVIVTPHVAGVTEYSYRAMAKVVGDCALQIHAGEPLTGVEVVN